MLPGVSSGQDLLYHCNCIGFIYSTKEGRALLRDDCHSLFILAAMASPPLWVFVILQYNHKQAVFQRPQWVQQSENIPMVTRAVRGVFV